MLSLTRIFLYNWGPFSHELLEIERPHLDRHNEQEWSALLDAIQLALTADLACIPSLPVGPVGPDERGEEPGPFSNPDQDHYSLAPSYVALEFTDTLQSSHITCGVCLEPEPVGRRGALQEGEQEYPAHAFFLVPEALEVELFLPDGYAQTCQDLRRNLRSIRDAHSYEQEEAYLDYLLTVFGNLSPRFFPLFVQAMRSEPLHTMQEFVRQWMLETCPLDIETLQRIAEPYAQLNSAAREVEEKLSALRGIVERQERARSLQQRFAEQTTLAALLRREATTRHIAFCESQRTRLQEQIAHAETERADAQKTMQDGREALLEAELRLRQTAVMQQREEIQHEIKQTTSEATMIHSRWLALLHDLKHEEAMLHPLLSAELPEALPPDPLHPSEKLLRAEEYRTLRSLLYTIASCEENTPPPRRLARLIDGVLPALDAALARTQELLFQRREHIHALRDQGRAVEQKLRYLRQGGYHYPEAIERVCTLLTHMFGERPPLLCEVLEVSDERWQDAVEAMLGPLRFTILVQPAHAAIARQVIGQAYANEQLTNVGVLDISAAMSQRQHLLPNSLAFYVKTEFPALQSYVHAVLGDIIACESAEQLPRHRRAITPNRMLYSGWTLRVLPPESSRPWFIGKRGRASQREACEQELREISDNLIAATRQANSINGQIMRLKRSRELSNLRQRLDDPLDETPLREKITCLLSQQQSQDMSEIEELRQEVERLRAIIASEEETVYQLMASIAAWQTEIQQVESDLHTAQVARAAVERYPAAAATAQEQIKHYFPASPAAQPDHTWERDDELLIAADIRKTEQAARELETQATEEMQRLIRDATAYNTRYHIAAKADDPTEERYATEEQHLLETELPRYRDHIEQARRRAAEGLRDEILRPLYERVVAVQRQMERFNEVLVRLELSGERYRFAMQPDPSLLPYYELVMGLPALESGSLSMLQNEFYLAHRPTIDQLYQTLTRSPQTEQEQQERERMLDYRNYFQYFVEVHHASGDVSSINPFDGTALATERFLPLYLTIAAAFAPLYRINEKQSRSTVRLIVFKSMFAAIQRRDVEMVLETFERLGLQVITAALESGEQGAGSREQEAER
jgi:hypothetical protein